MPKVGIMLIPTLLKGPPCETSVSFNFPIVPPYHCSLIHKARSLALSIEGTWGLFPPHLQGGIGEGGLASLDTAELCLAIMDFIFGMHLYAILMVFLLIILLSGFDFGKQSL